MEETESRLTRFVIYALSARTIGQCSHFQSLSLGFVADIVPIDAREKSFSKVTLFDSTWRGEKRRNQDRSVLILDDQENIVREHEFPSRLPYPRNNLHERARKRSVETRAGIERWSRRNFHARLYAFILEYRGE